jgi:hypothetical protein
VRAIAVHEAALVVVKSNAASHDIILSATVALCKDNVINIVELGSAPICLRSSRLSKRDAALEDVIVGERALRSETSVGVRVAHATEHQRVMRAVEDQPHIIAAALRAGLIMVGGAVSQRDILRELVLNEMMRHTDEEAAALVMGFASLHQNVM